MRNETTESEKNLTAHIQRENAKRSAWAAEDPKNRVVFLAVDDIEHWRSYGIHSVEDYDRYQLVNVIVDLHKDAFGFKPSYGELMSMTTEDLQEQLISVERSLKATMEGEANAEAIKVEEFEAAITKTMETGNVDRNTAMGWLLDAEIEDNYEKSPDYLIWSLGLPSKYAKEFEKALA
jgi:hypothetical protein